MLFFWSAQILAFNGHAAPHSEGFGRYTQDRGGLMPFELIGIDQFEYPPDQYLVVALCDNIAGALFFFYVLIENLV